MADPAPLNPYAAPAVVEPIGSGPIASNSPAFQLYSVSAITLAGFLGAIMAAATLLALNYLRVGRHLAAATMLNLGALFTIGNFALTFVLPEEAPSWPFWIGHTLLAYVLAAGTQSHLVADHQRRGGKLASIWWAVGISIVVSICTLVLYFVVMEVVPDRYLGIE